MSSILEHALEQNIETFTRTGSMDTILTVMHLCRSHQYPYIAITVGKHCTPFFKSNHRFMHELALAYRDTEQYTHAWAIYTELFRRYLPPSVMETYIQHSSTMIPFIQTLYTKYPQQIIQQIPPQPITLPLVTCSITTCKRLDLFEQTMNSFLQCCQDVLLISQWICIDDASSTTDRERMASLYPFIHFIWKTPEQKGHAQSMNMILEHVQTPYLLHLEDDWLFIRPALYIQQCLDVLQHDATLGQCLINQHYTETHDDVYIVGGIPCQTNNGVHYIRHSNQPPDGLNNAYWPHYSLRPGMNRVAMLKEVGDYRADTDHFEMDFAYRYTACGFQTAFLYGISCIHIGRLTKDRFDMTKENAYTLNGQPQFGKPPPTNVAAPIGVSSQSVHDTPHSSVPPPPHPSLRQSSSMYPIHTAWTINLDRRTDRWRVMVGECQANQLDMERFPAIDGTQLIATRWLEQWIQGNNFNSRRGMVGCALSHLTLWCRIVEQHTDDNTIYLIMEDDIQLIHDFPIKFNYVCKQLDLYPEWDIVFLGHHIYDSAKSTTTYNPHLLPNLERWTTHESMTRSRGGTGGYLISARGARRILPLFLDTCLIRGIDTMMQLLCDQLHIYYLTTHLYHSSCYSMETADIHDTDIQRDYHSLQRTDDQRFNDELAYFKEQRVDITLCRDGQTCHSEEDGVVLCSRACPHEKGQSYAIGNAWNVYIPQAMMKGDLDRYSFYHCGTYTVDPLIRQMSD